MAAIKKKAAKAYEDMMHQAFKEANRVLKANGIMIVVYAHKTTAGWSTLIDSLRRAGFMITEAWPLDTEMGARLRGQNSAALASSIFLISRKRTQNTIGDYTSQVQPQLKTIIQNRVTTLMEQGVSGADLTIACIGAGLQAYTQYDRVELPNGDEIPATTFLDEVRREVTETILKQIMGIQERGISTIDPFTQYYIIARYEYNEAIIDFDEANTLARGLGVELDGPNSLTDGKNPLIQKTKNTVKLRNYQERGNNLNLTNSDPNPQISIFNTPPDPTPPTTLIDILHRLLWLTEHQPRDISAFLIDTNTQIDQLRLVAQALAGRALTDNNPLPQNPTPQRSKEQQAIDTLLASWKRTIEDAARIRT